MNTKLFITLLLGVGFLFFGCSEDNSLLPEQNTDQSGSILKSAKNPGPSLSGVLETEFSFTPPTFWNGTVDFGDMGTYGITFISYGAPRDYSQASPFQEDFVIFKLGTDWTVQENVILKGWDSGVLVLANKDPELVKFTAHGKVTEAYGPLEMWNGRNAHFKGVVEWVQLGLPKAVHGELRIN